MAFKPPRPAVKVGYVSGGGAVIAGQSYAYAPRIAGARPGGITAAVFLQVGRQQALMGTGAIHPPGAQAAMLAAYPDP